MLTEFFPIQLLLRWSAQLENSLVRLGSGKTMERRLSGDWKFDRAEAKLFLLACAPFVPCMISDALDYERGIVWHIWAWPSTAWFVVVLLWGLVAACRGCVRGIRLWRRRRR